MPATPHEPNLWTRLAAATVLAAALLGCAGGAGPQQFKATFKNTRALGRTVGLATQIGAGATYGQAKLSPDGTRLAIVHRDDKGLGLAMFAVPTLKPLGRIRAPSSVGIYDYVWASNERLVMELTESPSPLSPPRRLGELYAVDADGKNGKMVFGYRAVDSIAGLRRGRKRPDYAWAKILDAQPEDPRQVLIRADRWPNNPLQRRFERTFYLLDVVDRDKTRISLPEGAVGVSLDGRGQIALALIEAQGGLRWALRDANKEWTMVEDPRAVLGEDAEVVGRLVDGHFDVLDRVEGKPEGVWRVEAATGARTLLSVRDFEAPASFDYDPRGQVAGVVYEGPYPERSIVAPTSDVGQRLATITSAFPGGFPFIEDQSRDGRFSVVLVTSDRDPGRYYLFDHEGRRATKLVDLYEGLDTSKFGPREAFQVKTKDGLTISGYLTFPPHTDTAKNAPMVVVPHGGPVARDHWFFDPQAHFLASHGFLVLQVNFRGSSGFGSAFEHAGDGQWGLAIQDDIALAVRWAIQAGLADRDRVCIFGASFGAYSAMMSAIRYPGWYRCAAGLSGVYDLETLESDSDTGESKTGRAYLARALGDEASRKAQSPLHLVDGLEVPVLLVHGGKDRRTPIGAAEDLRDALEARGRAVDWVEYDAEGHGLDLPTSRTSFLIRLVAFLDEHLY